MRIDLMYATFHRTTTMFDSETVGFLELTYWLGLFFLTCPYELDFDMQRSMRVQIGLKILSKGFKMRSPDDSLCKQASTQQQANSLKI